MKPLPCTPDLVAVAPRWCGSRQPEKALADPIRFMAYLMTYGTPDDIAVVRRHVGDDGFREAIENAPPGILMNAPGLIGMQWPGVTRRRHAAAPASQIRACRDQRCAG